MNIADQRIARDCANRKPGHDKDSCNGCNTHTGNPETKDIRGLTGELRV